MASLHPGFRSFKESKTQIFIICLFFVFVMGVLSTVILTLASNDIFYIFLSTVRYFYRNAFFQSCYFKIVSFQLWVGYLVLAWCAPIMLLMVVMVLRGTMSDPSLPTAELEVWEAGGPPLEWYVICFLVFHKREKSRSKEEG